MTVHSDDLPYPLRSRLALSRAIFADFAADLEAEADPDWFGWSMRLHAALGRLADEVDAARLPAPRRRLAVRYPAMLGAAAGAPAAVAALVAEGVRGTVITVLTVTGVIGAGVCAALAGWHRR